MPDLTRERDRLRELIDALDPEDDQAFRAVIAAALEASPEGAVKTARAIARDLTVSFPTVRRWAKGRSAPHPAMRLPIAKRLRALFNL